MTNRLSLSDDFSLKLRKYFLSSLNILIAVFLFTRAAVVFRIIAIVFLAIGVFYLFLRKIEFDDDHVYIGTKKYAFRQLTKMGSVEINLYIFPYIEINDKGKKRRVITDAGQAGILRILLGILVPSLDPMKNVKQFKELFDASRKH